MINFQDLTLEQEADLISKIESAVQSVIKREITSLKNGKVERNFTPYFAKEIERNISIVNIRSDPFYNKHLGAAKRLNGKVIELDIAVHERDIDINNLVAIELETSNYPKKDDVWKIEGLTQKLGGYGYRLGLFIVFGISNRAGDIIIKKWFKNGKPLNE
jgi:hypothetical protein